MIGEDLFIDDSDTIVGSRAIVRYYNQNHKIEGDSGKKEVGFKIWIV